MKHNRNARDLYSEYIDAASEDRAMMEVSFNLGFYPSACADAARYAEKIVKARLVSEGKNPSRVHDIDDLIKELDDFQLKNEALEIASVLSQYATQATYPTRIRRTITKETAEIIMEYAIRMESLLGIYAPAKPYRKFHSNGNRKRTHGWTIRRRHRREIK